MPSRARPRAFRRPRLWRVRCAGSVRRVPQAPPPRLNIRLRSTRNTRPDVPHPLPRASVRTIWLCRVLSYFIFTRILSAAPPAPAGLSVSLFLRRRPHSVLRPTVHLCFTTNVLWRLPSCFSHSELHVLRPASRMSCDVMSFNRLRPFCIAFRKLRHSRIYMVW